MLLPFVNTKKEEYNTKYNEIIRVNEQYQQNEMSSEEFNEALIPLAYDLYRLNGNYVIVSTICFIGYFVFFQSVAQGQTIGKKICKLRVCSTNEKKLTMVNYFVRALVLYNILIPILELIIVYTMKVDTYYNTYQNVNMIGYIIMYISLFLMLVREDNRGLHDLFANTIVKNEEPTKVLPKPIEEEKTENQTPKEPKKTKTTTKPKTEPKKTKPTNKK